MPLTPQEKMRRHHAKMDEAKKELVRAKDKLRKQAKKKQLSPKQLLQLKNKNQDTE